MKANLGMKPESGGGIAKRITEHGETALIKTYLDLLDMWANQSGLLFILIWLEGLLFATKKSQLIYKASGKVDLSRKWI